ncbi:MAG: hypothetical protein AB1743_00475 [Actinomycetota bacterium]
MASRWSVIYFLRLLLSHYLISLDYSCINKNGVKMPHQRKIDELSAGSNMGVHACITLILKIKGRHGA